MRHAGPHALLVSIAIASGLMAAWPAPLPAEEAAETVTGIFSVVWGDPHPDSGEGSQVQLWLTEESEKTHVLSFSEEFVAAHGDLLGLDGRRVQVWLAPEDATDVAVPVGVRRALAVKVLSDPVEGRSRDVSGSQPWVSIMCKFADKPNEPYDLSCVQEMYANTPGELDHYWRELSYGNIDVVGSVAVDWVTLPGSQTSYIPNPGSGNANQGTGANLSQLFDDCTAAATPFVDFTAGGTGGFKGINQMFNDVLDCCCWGGGRWAMLDGLSKYWSVTWEAPWGYDDICVIAHEMGHGFGLPHSNNWDQDGSPYDNSWDVMSDSWHNAAGDPVYGTMGKHTIAYHKDMLGWIAAGEIFEVDSDGVFTIDIDDLALAAADDYRMAKIPVPGGGLFYTVEVRGQTGTYDQNLPGDAVIIHEVDVSRAEDAWAWDAASPGSECPRADCESVMLRVGEVFQDADAGIRVSVDAATADGFQVTISTGDVYLFADGFESGDTTDWDSSGR